MKTSTEPWGIHWFRRDLRVIGNAGLRHNWRRHQGRVVGIFCFDAKFLSRPDFSHHRFAFFLETLRALRDELRAQGSDLLVVDQLAPEFFPRLLRSVPTRPALITFSRDYEPYARQRDSQIIDLLRAESIPVKSFRDHLIQEPHEVLKPAPGGFYQVYSPYARKWFSQMAGPKVQRRITSQYRAQPYFDRLKSGGLEKIFSLNWDQLGKPAPDALAHFTAENAKHVRIAIPAAGFGAAFTQLRDFAPRLKAYKDARNLPAETGTSRLSIFLKNGSLTTAQIFHELKLDQLGFLNAPSLAGEGQFAKELVWREFYYTVLYHRPDVERTAFLAKYANLNWENNEDFFRRWCEGGTGFPIVDAGMRELNTTGWMHNRVRMIVASFLTKDLLIDWRWGENYFMKMLLDGDLAPNNGGWQWAASTGCDPQPYFRIFNPWSQAKNFDPEGTYIRQYVPELRGVTVKALHDPQGDRGRAYPLPIIQHEVQRARALALYRSVR